MTAPHPKILIVILDNLGDAVMATAAFAPIKQAFPNAFLGLWVKQYTAGLFDGHPDVDRLHAADPFWDVSPGIPAGDFGHFCTVIKEIRDQEYDHAVLLNTEWRRALAIWIAGVPNRIGYDRRHSRLLLTTVVEPAAQPRHYIEDHRELVNAGFKIESRAESWRCRLQVSDRERAEARLWQQRAGLNSYWVAHLFSGDVQKNWPLEKWRQLIVAARERWPALKTVAMIGPSEATKLGPDDRAFFSQHTMLLQAPPLGMMKALLKNAQLMVGGDSGPGHVACALGTPVVSLFGITSPDRGGAVGQAQTRYHSASAIAAIPVSEVLASMAELRPRV
jgi:heptosyltransferase-1